MNGTKAIAAAAAVGILFCAGCHFVTDFDQVQIKTSEYRVYVIDGVADREGLDVLLVVDTTNPTHLQQLKSAMAGWLGMVAGAQDGMYTNNEPDENIDAPVPGDRAVPMTIHVGFVAADMGAGYPGGTPMVEGCTNEGENGRMIYPQDPGSVHHPGGEDRIPKGFIGMTFRALRVIDACSRR